MTREQCREWSFRSALYVRSGQRGPPTKEIIIDELQGIVRFTFHAGMVEEFKRLSANALRSCVPRISAHCRMTPLQRRRVPGDRPRAVPRLRHAHPARPEHGRLDGSHHGNGHRQRRVPGARTGSSGPNSPAARWCIRAVPVAVADEMRNVAGEPHRRVAAAPTAGSWPLICAGTSGMVSLAHHGRSGAALLRSSPTLPDLVERESVLRLGEVEDAAGNFGQP